MKHQKNSKKHQSGFLDNENIQEQWSKGLETRYRVPEAVRYVGNTAESAGALVLPMLTEVLTMGASPLGDMAIAFGISRVAKAFNTVKKSVKASDIVFGLTAMGGAAKSGL